MKPEESFVGQSVRSLQTMLRVIGETDASIPFLVPDGIYGQSTIQAVSAFQRQYGLPPTGITDQTTWEQIADVYDEAIVRIGEAQPVEIILEPDQVFRRGDRSPYLYLMQAMLLSLSEQTTNMDPPEISGTLDNPTAQALAGFQVLAGLPATGELDRITWRYLTHHFTLFANHNSRFANS